MRILDNEEDKNKRTRLFLIFVSIIFSYFNNEALLFTNYKRTRIFRKSRKK